MGLIERAVERDSQAPRAAAPADPAPRREPGAEPTAGAGEFRLDFAALKSKGFFTPEAAETAQALELRAIKRRLLRRVGFLQRAGEDARSRQRGGRQRNLVLVTSTRPGEGKTFSAVNLALSLAIEDRQRVLLIDADAPRPKICKSLGLTTGTDDDRGLTDAIADPALDPAALIRREEKLPLEILGEGARTDDAASLLASARGRKLITELSQADPGRLIIIDSPPVLATTDAIILAKQVDEIVFVVEADATPQPAIASALDELLELNPNVSLLLNRCLIAAGGSHYGAYEHYERNPGPASAASRDAKMGADGARG